MYNKLIIMLALALLAVTGKAQDAAGQLVLSLDDCIRIALNENPTIKVAEMEIERVDYSKKETLGQLLPEVNFSGQYTRNLALQTIYMDAGDGQTRAIKMGRDNTYNTGFSASIPLVVPQLWKTLKLSDNQILQNMEKARASRIDLVNQVKNAYYSLLLANDSKRVIEENHETAKLNADIFAKKFELGTASEYDMLRANVAVTNLEPSILEAENSINQLKLQLKLLMGMDARLNITPSQTLDDFKGNMYEHALVDTSLVNNTAMKSLDLQTDYLQKALEVQKASWWPTLTGSANLMWSSMSNGSPFKNFMWSKSSSVGLTLAIPLFQGGRRYYRQKQAEIAVREMKWQRENLERSLHVQVQNELNSISKSLKQIESNEGGVRQATKANEIMQQSFKIGSGTFIQLRDTEDALMSARLAYYQAIYNFLIAESNLEHVLGNAPINQYISK
ncbi:MAG: TolC family protein [Muribaculaceae bacterium]|nr:TolC family protein [Muribaculaceae bacterium]